MSNFRTIDRETGFLLPPSVDEWLPERHLARFVVEVIDGLDLRAMSGAYRGSGSASYHPRMLLGLLVYGYATGVFSSRKLERAMFRHEPLEDDIAEAQLARKSDNDLRIDLTAALESLPAHYLEVVLLRDFEELTIAEIADRLGEQSGAIKSRLHRARELVREYMLGPEAVSPTKRPHA